MAGPFGSHLRCAAFTLIELLVVVAVMMILAGLIFPITGAVKRARVTSITRAELQQVASAISDYKAKHGTYPPDNPNNIATNQLYYELVGTTFSNNTYVTRDGKSSVPAATIPAAFAPNITGFVNCTRGAGSDEGTVAQTFIRNLKPAQVAEVNNVKILVGSVGWPGPGSTTTPNPWRYVQSNPTNNPQSFDLWIDVMIGNKTNRISNWSQKPIAL